MLLCVVGYLMTNCKIPFQHNSKDWRNFENLSKLWKNLGACKFRKQKQPARIYTWIQCI